MKLPLKWLKEYTDYDVTHEVFVEKMMWRGFEIASVENELADVTGVVVGRIQALEAHPDADKLHVCSVDVGDGALHTIVCGAPNARAGMRTPVALPGATLPGGVTIQKARMRGVQSAGMLCSGKELGLTNLDYPGSEIDGILELQADCVLGAPIAEAIGMDDVIFDIELTPNRPDCQSIIGICREAAAALVKPFRAHAVREIQAAGHAGDYARVTVQNTELCPRYAARVITDINIEPSPAWMQKKLRSVGLRPINNIVDITNLVMVEYGHPMHAFDLSCVEEGHIVVRNAFENEVVRTLDGKNRQVDPDMLLIADPKKGVGIAGVMGGENSEIKPETAVVLFEAAVFKGSNIRATARKLKHTTDAAARFIKGVEAVNAKKALDRAVELVDELKAGRIVGDTIDACAVSLLDRVVDVDVAHINRVLNLALPAASMADMLATIQIPATPIEAHTLRIQVPHYRTDIESGIEADWDIAEEIARIYGYYNIQPTLMRGDTFRGGLTPPFRLEDDIKDTLCALGTYEMYNYNFTGPAHLDALALDEKDEKRLAVRLLNPFGEDQSLMRTTLIPGMLRVAALNRNRKTGHGRFFEVGNVHFDNSNTLPEERKLVGMLFFGEEDFFSLKGAVEDLLERIGVAGAVYTRGGGNYLHPGQKALLHAQGVYIGELGQVHPQTAGAFDLEEPVYVAELRFDVLMQLHTRERTYRALPRYPVVMRDLALIVDENVLSDTLKAVIEGAKTDVCIEQVALFDVFRGGNIPAGKKSMAYSFTLRHEARTLNEEDITAAIGSIIAALDAAGAKLRA